MISAILLSWRRHQNVRRIVDALRESPLIAEVLVINNDATTPLRLPGATVHNLGDNLRFLARYLFVPSAKHETILFQDDDVLLDDGQIEALARAVAEDPQRLIGPRGRRLSGDESLMRPGLAYGDVDLICGACSLFTKALYAKAWPLVLEYLTRPSEFFEDDVAFSLAATRATGRRPYAVNVEPIQDLGTRDEHATNRLHNYAPGRRAVIEHFAGVSA